MADINKTIGVILKAQDQTAAAFAKLNKNLGDMKHAAEALVAALAFKDVVDSTNQLGQQIDELRDNLGITAEEASRLNYAARVMGTSADEVSNAFGALNRKLIDQIPLLSRGASDFQKWGVSVQDAQGNILTFPEVLNNVRDVLRQLPAGFERSGAAMDLMGRNGRQLLDLMTLSDAQFKSLAKEAEDLGLIFSEAGVDSLEEFQHNLNRLDLQFDAIKLQIGQFLVPAFRTLVQWVQQNSGQIKVFGETIGRVAGVVKEWASAIGNAWDQLKQIFGTIGSTELALDLLVLAFAALNGGPVVLALAAVILAIKEVLKTIDFVRQNWDTFVNALRNDQLDDIPIFGFFFRKIADVMHAIDEASAAWRGLQILLHGGDNISPSGPNPINPRSPLGREGEGVLSIDTGHVAQSIIEGASAGSNFGPVGSAVGAALGALSGSNTAVTTTTPPPPPSTPPGGGGSGSYLGFADGGVVPGPLGAPVPALVHGGEVITPPGRGGMGSVTVVLNGPTIAASINELAEAVADQVGAVVLKRMLVNRNTAY